MQNSANKLILATASKARLALCQQIGINPDLIIPADIDESALKNENPADYVKRIAVEKALAVKKLYPDAIILAADTTCYARHKIIGKAADEAEARQILNMLLGRRHRVYSGVCVISPAGTIYSKTVESTVQLARIEQRELDEYISSGDWRGKAGAFSLQGRGAAFVQALHGCPNNVVGLPLRQTVNLLKQAGWKISSGEEPKT